MRKLGFIVTVVLLLTALYYLSMALFQPKTPQVVVVKPSGSQTTNQSGGPVAIQTPVPVGGPYACTKPVYLKIGSVSLCADIIYSMVKTDESIQVDFQGGTIQGLFMFASVPACPVTTTTQGVLIPCRAQVIIPLKQ